MALLGAVVVHARATLFLGFGLDHRAVSVVLVFSALLAFPSAPASLLPVTLSLALRVEGMVPVMMASKVRGSAHVRLAMLAALAPFPVRRRAVSFVAAMGRVTAAGRQQALASAREIL